MMHRKSQMRITVTIYCYHLDRLLTFIITLGFNISASTEASWVAEYFHFLAHS
uniref:Uncharacterized protein n=1 Tax=Anguilla anguilla TaxID=7936 RepID=A0A0E9UJC2_ANGAN